jgi:hypothetical protein
VIDDCKKHGAFDPVTMGTVPNVGLMAQKAEEYGSHDKTFQIPADGTVRVVDEAGTVLIEQPSRPATSGACARPRTRRSRTGSSWRSTARALTGTPAVFWLDAARAHDAQIIAKVETYLKNHDTNGLDIRILTPVEATKFSLDRIRKGKDTISVTGNVLRDYLTDLFPIMELGTSAKMLSIVPLMAGRRPVRDRRRRLGAQARAAVRGRGYLRWDSLGEFLALAASLEHLGNAYGTTRRPGAGQDAGPGQPASSSTTTSRRRARSAVSTTAAATSTSRCTGRRRWPRKPTTPRCKAASLRWPRRWPTTKRGSSPNWPRYKASRWTSAATIVRTWPTDEQGHAPEQHVQPGIGRTVRLDSAFMAIEKRTRASARVFFGLHSGKFCELRRHLFRSEVVRRFVKTA